MDSVIQAMQDVRPETGVQSFTEHSDERRQLFQEAKARGLNTSLAPVTWAFLQVADLESVRELIRSRVLWANLADGENPLLQEQVFHTMRLWRQKPAAKPMTAGSATPAQSTQNASSSQPFSPSFCPGVTPDSNLCARSKRKHGQKEYSIEWSPIVAQSCKQRDRNLCAVSKMGEIDVAHVYPWCAFGAEPSRRVEHFWQVMKMFWNPEVVEWRGKIFVDQNYPNKGTETVANMISLTAILHRFHSADGFALRPIQMSDDKTQLKLEFHWLVREERKSSDKVDLMEEPSFSRGLPLSGQGYGPFIRIDPANGTFLPLVNGTRFTLSTDDPVNKPLPDPGLLTLQ